MFCILFAFTFYIQGVSGQNENPIRSLSTGHTLEGYQARTAAGHSGHVFLGVPFAEPPIGQLRFQKTKPLSPLLDASPIPIPCRAYKPSCWQNHSTVADKRILSMNEDCLYLNVFSGLECGPAGSLCPVLYYIHGGAFEFDSPTMFSVDVLVDNFASKGIVVVTVPYRLGALGFWSTGGPEAPGNNGLYDVLEGLHWVQREIRTFGGDSSHVTIMGQSAGAAIVSLMTLTPKSEGLFNRAVLMSGAYVISDDLDPYRELAKELGCATDEDWSVIDKKGSDVIDCMRSVDAQHLVDTYWRIEGTFGKHLTAPRTDGPDGLFPAPPPTLAKNRRRIDAIIGTTADENSFEKILHLNATPKTVSELCQSKISGQNLKRQKVLVTECERRYVRSPLRDSLAVGFASNGQPSKFSLWAEQVAKFKNDNFYFSPAFDEATSLARVGSRVFLYSFDYVKRGLEGMAPWHAFDLTYILGIHPFEFDARDRQIQATYASLFGNFVKYGHPTPSAEASLVWKPLEEPPFDMHYLSIDLPLPLMKPRYHYDAVLFWSYIVPTVGQRGEGRERGRDVIRSYQYPSTIPDWKKTINSELVGPKSQRAMTSDGHRDHVLVTALSVSASVVVTIAAALAMYALWRGRQKSEVDARRWRWPRRKHDKDHLLLDGSEKCYRTF